MTDASTDGEDRRIPVPRLRFVGGHPTVADPNNRPDGKVCVCCALETGFLMRRCVRGLVVHLIEPLEIDEDPDGFADNPWVRAGAIDQARTWWVDRAAVITRAAAGHPRFQVCPDCTVARMESGEIPFMLPQWVPPVIMRK